MRNEFPAELVKRGRQFVANESKSRWQLGDLALEVVPMGERGHNNEAGARLLRFAEKIGLPDASLTQYRRVARAWPDGTRVSSIPWSIHRLLAGRDDRAEVIRSCEDMTYQQAHERFAPSPTAKTGTERAERWIESGRRLFEKLPDEEFEHLEEELRKLIDFLERMLPGKEARHGNG